MPTSQETLADLAIVLRCVAGLPRSYGRRTLVHLLRGSSAPHTASPLPDSPFLGALVHRSETAIEQMLDQLVQNNLLRFRQLNHGGTVVDMTPAGRQALARPDQLKRALPATE